MQLRHREPSKPRGRIEKILEREAVSCSSRDADSGDGEVHDHNHEHEHALNSPTNSATLRKNVRGISPVLETVDKVTIRAELQLDHGSHGRGEPR